LIEEKMCTAKMDDAQNGPQDGGGAEQEEERDDTGSSDLTVT
jgi:hypothetical protein